MTYIVIGKTIGFTSIENLRLLNIEDYTHTDINIQTVIKLIKTGQIDILNVRVDGNTLVGTAGSIEKIPEITINNNNKALTILNQIEDVGYTVVNCVGKVMNTRTNDLIAYGEKFGIVNGEIVTKESQKFIRSITGSFEVKTLEDLQKKAILTENYTGEKIGDSKYKYIVASNIKVNNRHLYCWANSSIYYIENNKLQVKRSRKKHTKETIEKDRAVLIGDYIEHSYKAHDIEGIKGLLKYDTVYQLINTGIQIVNNSCGNVQLHPKFNIPIPTNKIEYRPLYVEKSNLGPINTSVNVDLEAERFEIMNTKLSVIDSIYKDKYIPVCRQVTPQGINYYVTTYEGKEQDKIITLEDIIGNTSMFINTHIDEDTITVESLDGIFKYDIEKIKARYRREIKKSSSNTKAKLLGLNYKENISIDGTLTELVSDRDILTIPDGVTKITYKSIQVGSNCRKIEIPASVWHIEEGFNKTRLDSVRELDLECIEEVRKVMYDTVIPKYHSKSIKINIKSPVQSEEIIRLVLGYEVDLGNITVDGGTEFITKELVQSIINRAVGKLEKAYIFMKSLQFNSSSHNYRGYLLDYRHQESLSEVQDKYSELKEITDKYSVNDEKTIDKLNKLGRKLHLAMSLIDSQLKDLNGK